MINEAHLPIAPETSDWKLPSSRKVAIACLVLTETSLFSIFVAASFFYVGKSLTGPTPRGVLALPVFSTFFLLWSSGRFLLADRVLNGDGVGLLKLFWFAKIVRAGFFLTMTAV